MHFSDMKLIGPFKQLLTFSSLPLRGALKDEQLVVLEDAGVLVEDGLIRQVGRYSSLVSGADQVEELEEDLVGLPGFIDAHTHCCFGGSRAADFAARNNGKSYQDIAKAGGGIWDTVTKTRSASQDDLMFSMQSRLDRMAKQGITTVEVKSGYGLSVEQELKMLNAIKACGEKHALDVVPTCLAAHIVPKEYTQAADYLQSVLRELVPQIKRHQLTNRFDIFIEENAFTASVASDYLKSLQADGFALTVHGDQFTTGGSQVAIDCGAISVDHLEASGEREINSS